MKIVLKKINIERIYEKLNEWKEIEFKKYPVFKTIIENYINNTTIGVISTYTILLMLNSFDKMVKEKNEYVTLPINSAIYMVNPYTNESMFETKFDYCIKEKEIEVFLNINPKKQEDEISMFVINPIINEFKKFSETLKEEDVQNAIIDTIKLKLSDGFESVLTIVRLEENEKKRLEIEENIDFYYKQIAYILDPYETSSLYKEAVNKKE
jgi:hypothetical protein